MPRRSTCAWSESCRCSTERPLIAGVISLGEAFLIGTLGVAGAVAAHRAPRTVQGVLLAGGLAGLLTGLALSLLVLVGNAVNLRQWFLNASPELYSVLTFDLGVAGAWIPAVAGLLIGAGAGAYALLPAWLRSPVTRGLLAVLLLGLFAGLLRQRLLATGFGGPARFMFASEGLTIIGAVITFVAVVAGRALRQRIPVRRTVTSIPGATDQRLRLVVAVLLVLLIVALPLLLGDFVARVIATVALYVLMGLGLNITLGLAGLLDLGFVAFFAVGAYTVGLLTSSAEFGLARLAVLGRNSGRGHRRDALRSVPRPADPRHPRRLPGDRHAWIRRDHRVARAIRPAQGRPRRPAGHHEHPEAVRPAGDELLRR